MNDYGAGGAALFDIVNVQILDAAPSPAHLSGRFPLRKRRRVPFVNIHSLA
jgi:hypothetical protein